MKHSFAVTPWNRYFELPCGFPPPLELALDWRQEQGGEGSGNTHWQGTKMQERKHERTAVNKCSSTLFMNFYLLKCSLKGFSIKITLVFVINNWLSTRKLMRPLRDYCTKTWQQTINNPLKCTYRSVSETELQNVSKVQNKYIVKE